MFKKIFFLTVLVFIIFAFVSSAYCAQLTVNKSVVQPGEKITVSFSGIFSPAQQDWISLYKRGTPNENYGEWYYLKGQSSGTLTFTAPKEPGEYEFRLFLNWPTGGYKDMARSGIIKIMPKGASDKPNIFYNPMYKGYRLDVCLTWGSSCDEPVATRFCQEMGYTKAKAWERDSDIGHITPTYIIGDGKICNQSYCDGFKFIECEGSGIMLPPSTQMSTTPVLMVNQTSVYAVEKITVAFSGISSPAQQDWISLYRIGTPNEKYGEWYYLKGQGSGTLTFTVPNEPGDYEFRLFLNWPQGGYKDVARSRPIKVMSKGTPSDKPNTFYNPTYKGYRLDICLTWGSNCQEPAATRFCKEMGYTKAKSWEIAHDIGHITPTYVIGDGKICNQSFCDGFKFIECEGGSGTFPPSTPASKELISNGAFRSLSGWTIHEWYQPSSGKGEVTVAGDGIRFKSVLGNNRIGIMQALNADVSSCSSLVLSATIKADYQTLTGTGWQGREAPVAVFMSYTDVNGVAHNLLSENPNDTAGRMFWHGFYYADPAPPSLTVFGTKLNKSSWQTYTVNLTALNPRPAFIQFIGAEGAGWAQRDGKIGSMSLKCGKGETSVQQPYQPPASNNPQGDIILIPQGKDDFWKGNVYENK